MLLFCILAYIWSAVFVVVTSRSEPSRGDITSIPSRPVTLVLYDRKATWNDARKICQANDGKLVRIDTAAKAEAITFIPGLRKYWFALHKSSLIDPAYVWLNCGGQGELNLFNSDKKSYGNCVAGQKLLNNTWIATPCYEQLQFICEKPWVSRCTFETLSDTTMDMSRYPGESLTVETANCQETCLTFVNRTLQCWAYTSDPKSVCTLYIDAAFGIVQDPSNRKKKHKTTFNRKVCFESSSGTTPDVLSVDQSDAPRTPCWLNITAHAAQTSHTTTASETIEYSTFADDDTAPLIKESQLPISTAFSTRYTTTSGQTATHTDSDSPSFSPTGETNTVVSHSSSTPVASNTGMEQQHMLSASVLQDSPNIGSDTKRHSSKKTTIVTPYYPSSSVLSYVAHSKTDKPLRGVFQTTANTDTKTRRNLFLTGYTQIKSDAISVTPVEEQSTDHSVTPESKEIVCSCECVSKPSQDTGIMKDLLKSLNVQKEELSSHRRKVTSASDPRVSSVACGVFGITIICFIFGVIILTDVQIFFGHSKA